MKKKIVSMMFAVTMVIGCVAGTGRLANAANPNVQNKSYSFNSCISVGNTSWENKNNTTKVFVNPQKGPKIYYTVGGLKGKTSYKCSKTFLIAKDTKASITNSVREAGCTKARLRFEPYTSNVNINTSGVWSPDSTKNYTVY